MSEYSSVGNYRMAPLVLSVALMCCTNDAFTNSCPAPSVAVQTRELTGGTPEGEFLAISAKQGRAVGRVWPLGATPGYFCTGVLISPRWVLTASHCDWNSGFVFTPGEAAGGQGEAPAINSIKVWASDEYDALLIELESEAPVVPIEITRENADDSWLDMPVQLAGYGSTETGLPAEQLMFLVEPVVELGPSTITVSGSGLSGACIGDSGGPLLVRESDGRLGVAGILSTGSSSCRGLDTYLRADVLRSWISEHVVADGASSPEQECGDVTEAGFCRRDYAIWCAQGKLAARRCKGDLVCGWSVPDAGYRCVAPEQNGCQGIDDLGVCEEGMAKRCSHGAVLQSDCESCGLRCGVDRSTGRATCLAEEALENI